MNKNAFMGGNVQWEYGKKLRCYQQFHSGVFSVKNVYNISKEMRKQDE